MSTRWVDDDGTTRLVGRIVGGGGSQNLEQVLAEGNNSGGASIDMATGGIANAGAIDGVSSLTGTGDGPWDTGGSDLNSNGGSISTFGGSIDTDGGGLALGTGTIGMASGEILDVAAHLAHGATVDQLLDALIACGLMASS